MAQPPMKQLHKELKEQVVQVLLEQPANQVSLSSFWTLFQKKYGSLPSKEVFKVSKLYELLRRCKPVCSIRKNSNGTETVSLRDRYRHTELSSDSDDSDTPVMLSQSAKRQRSHSGVTNPENLEQSQRDSRSALPYPGHSTSASNIAPPWHDEYTDQMQSTSWEQPWSVPTSNVPPSWPQTHYPGPSGFRGMNQAGGDQHRGWDGVSPRDQHRGWDGVSPRDQHRGRDGVSPRDQHRGRDGVSPRDQHRGRDGVSPRDQHRGREGVSPRDQHRGRQDGHVPSDEYTPNSIFSKPGKTFIPKGQLNNVAKDCIERLAESKTYVSVERIEKLILQHYNVDSLSQIMADNRGNIRQIDYIQSVHSHVRVQCKVNAYIQAFIKTHSMCTLHQLNQNTCAFAADGKDFETLNLGAFVHQPLVYEYFKFPTEKEIPEINTADVLEYIRMYLTEKKLWTSRNKGLEDLMQFICEKRGTDTPFELGIRIRSLPLAIQVLKRAQNNASQSVRTAIAHLSSSAEGELTTAFTNFTHSIIHKEPGICQIRQEYLSKSPKVLMETLFQKINVLYSSVTYLQQLHEVGKGQVRDVHRTQDVLHNFMNRLRQDKLMQQLFQLAICCSKDEIHSQLQEILNMGSSRAPPGESEDAGVSGKDKPVPSLGELIERIKKYIERCLSQGLNLAHMARIENKILEDLDFPHFYALGQGSFLDILAKNDNVKQFLDDSGVGSFGLSPGGSSGSLTYSVSREDLTDFVRQCAVADIGQGHVVETALCYHYGSSDVKDLGHGSIGHLIQVQTRLKKDNHCTVSYESALVAKSKHPLLVHSRKVGILGHRTKDQALACLENCPLLADMHEWSHWDIIFQPELGDLKDFVQKYGNVNTVNVMDKGGKAQLTTSIMCLEVRPGCLLKITAKTSPEKLAQAALEGDIRGTCGHLVSLVVSNKGLENTGLVLLGNHVKTALIKMQAECVPGASGSSTGGATGSAKFVLDCVTLLPRVLCLGVAQKVFLEPLSQVVGQTKSRDLLLQCATSDVTRGRLQLLGVMLGLEDWVQSFTDKISYPEDCLQRMEYLDPELADVIMIDDESDYESEEDEENSEIILSDSEYHDDVKAENTAEDNDMKLEGKMDIDTEKPDTNELIESSLEMPTEVVSDCEEDRPEVLGEGLTVVNEYKAVIDQIRREEFGVDVSLSEDGQKLMLKQQERLGRSLERLSRDLYSKDTHFVLELIQNADDNRYPDEFYSEKTKVKPSVKFIVDQASITVLNNECGFLEKNIRALCDVGRSTKGKHMSGYIGQKGIGFKSVFRVTDCPEIHSRGFHICFDVKSGPTAYILPHWIHEADEDSRTDDRWTTRIVLPLKAEVDTQSTQSLAARFHDVHPSLLLFLHRLKNLTVINKVENNTLKVQRQDMGNNIIEIQHSKGKDRWFVVKKTLDATKISLQAKSGVDVESTEIAMAFPLQTQDEIKARILPQKQPVFAFLPLRSYGFRFVIQGNTNFLGIDIPPSPNDKVMDGYGSHFVTRLHPQRLLVYTLKAHPDFSPLDAVCQFLQFVPSEEEVLDCFQAVATQILQLLRAQPCLPTSTGTSGDSSSGFQWKLPSQLVMATDQLIQEVIPSVILREHLSLDYLHPQVASVLNPTLIHNLGVQKLTVNHLLEIHKSMLKGREGLATERQVLQIAKWLTCMYRTMDDLQQNEDLLSSIQSLPTIPLANGTVVALADLPVFFPLDKDQSRKPGRNLLLALAKDLDTIHPRLLQAMDSVANSQVGRLLEQLGVKHLNAKEVIQHHVMPVLKTEAWKTKSRDLLVAYLVFIKEQLEINSTLLSMDELREVAILVTNHGPVKPSEISVHFTPAYSNRIDLQKLLPGYQWVLLDACYLDGSRTQTQVSHWRDFFAKLGVLDFINLKPEKVVLTKETLLTSPWKLYHDLFPDCETYVVNDVRCEEFESLVMKNKVSSTITDQLKALFEILDQSWDTIYSINSTVTTMADSEGNILREVETSFAMSLKNFAWIPAVVAQEANDDTLYSLDLKLMKPAELFVPKPDIERILAHHVPYLEPTVREHSHFSHFLGIHCKVNIEFMKQKLISWCDRDDNSDEPRRFMTSLTHIKYVYKYFYDNLPPKDLQDMLHQYPMILAFDSDLASKQPDIPNTGGFMARQEVRWSDPSGLFSKYKATFSSIDHKGVVTKPILNKHYHDMKDFFLTSVRVQKVPSMEEYTQLLLYISTMSPSCTQPIDVLHILSILGKEIMSIQKNTVSDTSMLDLQIRNIQQLIGENKCLPGKGKTTWISLSDKPMIADNKHFEDMFQTMDGVVFLNCGDKLNTMDQRKVAQDKCEINTDGIHTLYKTLGVEHLSDCVDVQPTTEMYQPCPPLQVYVRDVIGYIQQILAYGYQEIYNTFKEKDMINKLYSMTFGQVGQLEMVYMLKDMLDVPPVVQSEICKIIDDSAFNIHRDHVNSFNEINKELARYFSQGDSHCFRHLKDMLMEAMEYRGRKPRNFLKDHEIFPLPETENPWEIPEPVMFYPPLPPVPSMHQEQEAVMHTGDHTVTEGVGSAEVPQEGGGIRAWPPQSSDVSSSQYRGSNVPRSSVWPAPRPPEGFDKSSLPENLRPSKYADSVKPEEGVNRASPTQPGSHNVKSDYDGRSDDSQVTSVTQVLADRLVVNQDRPHQDHRVVRADMEVDTQPDSSSETGVVNRTAGTGACEPMVIEYEGMPSGVTNIRKTHKRVRVESGDTEQDLPSTPYARKPVFFHCPSMWTDDTSDAMYVELAKGPVLSIPSDMSLDDKVDQPEIGRWGEQLVNDYLHNVAASQDSDILHVTWMNQAEESGQPFDFLVKMKNLQDIFVEVKATVSSKKTFFEISSQEFQFAQKEGEKFHLYRVFNAGKHGMIRLTKLENLAAKMEAKEVRLCMVV